MSQAVAQDSATQSEKNKNFTTPIDGIIIKLAQRIGGDKAKEVERFIKFAFVGLLGFTLDFGTVFILQSTFLPPVDSNNENLIINVAIATTAGFILAVCSNFIWNRIWTYPDSRSSSIRKQLTQFAIVSVSGWTARTIWIAATYTLFGILSTSVIQAFSTSYDPSLLNQQKFGTMIAQFIGVIVVMVWNFLANRYWTYSDVA
jgi:putative flippase GtrA